MWTDQIQSLVCEKVGAIVSPLIENRLWSLANVHNTPNKVDNVKFFISTARPNVHTNPQKMLIKPEEFENAGFAF